MDVVHLFKGGWPFAVAMAPGVFAAWKAWQVRSDALRKDRKDLIQIAQEAAGAVIEELRTEIDRLRGELDQLRREHSEMMAAKDARIAILEGDLRNKEAECLALERELERHGIPLPTPRKRPYFELDQGRLEPHRVGGPPP